MEQGGTARPACWAARLIGDVGRCTARVGCRLILATVVCALFLAVAITATLVGESGVGTRITLKVPCARVDATTVGRSAYGLDQVLTASCLPPTHP
ncbi:MAG: hypothetical protein ACREQ5_30680 [Candidatus Dormibacteria bacterium]